MASSSSRPVSDEEVQKAREDLKGIMGGIFLDKFQCQLDVKEKAEKKKGKKTKLKRASPKVQYILNFKPKPLPILRILDDPEKRDDPIYKNLWATALAIDVLVRKSDEQFRQQQEVIRQKLEAKGYIEYETTDDEEEDEGVPRRRTPPAAGQRWRTPPGVTKLPGGGLEGMLIAGLTKLREGSRNKMITCCKCSRHPEFKL